MYEKNTPKQKRVAGLPFFCFTGLLRKVGLFWTLICERGGRVWWCGNSLGPEKSTNESQRLVGGGGRSIGPAVGGESQRNSPTSRRDSLVVVRGGMVVVLVVGC